MTWAARDAYSVMGLDRSATPQEVKERFRTLAKLLGAHGVLGEDGGGEHRFEGNYVCGRGKFSSRRCISHSPASLENHWNLFQSD